jgi:hypothetical protein
MLVETKFFIRTFFLITNDAGTCDRLRSEAIYLYLTRCDFGLGIGAIATLDGDFDIFIFSYTKMNSLLFFDSDTPSARSRVVH